LEVDLPQVPNNLWILLFDLRGKETGPSLTNIRDELLLFLFTESLSMKMANQIPILKLNNGITIPALGFGTFAKEGLAGKTHEAVIAALDAGYRHLDCAW